VQNKKIAVSQVPKVTEENDLGDTYIQLWKICWRKGAASKMWGACGNYVLKG
jgi:hypothetical protein